jgi:hypothetical protein
MYAGGRPNGVRESDVHEINGFDTWVRVQQKTIVLYMEKLVRRPAGSSPSVFLPTALCSGF